MNHGTTWKGRAAQLSGLRSEAALCSKASPLSTCAIIGKALRDAAPQHRV